MLLFATYGRDRVAYLRERMRPVVARLVDRAQQAGELREDFSPTDVPIIASMLATVAEYAAPCSRTLAALPRLIVDGLRPARDGVSPLPLPALTPEEMEQSCAPTASEASPPLTFPVAGRITHSRTAAGCKCTCIRTFPYSCAVYVHSQLAVKIIAIDRTISPCHLTCDFCWWKPGSPAWRVPPAPAAI